MLRLEQHHDVTRVILSTRRSRLAGYDVSAYLVDGVLVDCGFPAVARDIERFARERRPRGVMLTHSHEDHAGNAAVAARLGLPLVASEETLRVVSMAPPIELYRRVIWGQPEPLRGRTEPFGSDRLRLIPTPGHSSDHHVVWDEEHETLFGGDLFVGVRVRVAHEDENPREQVRSLRSVAALSPRRLFDAHRGAVRDPAASLLAKAEWMEETIGRIDELIALGWSNRAITRRVLGREELVHYFSAGHYAHVNLVRAIRRHAGPHTDA